MSLMSISNVTEFSVFEEGGWVGEIQVGFI